MIEQIIKKILLMIDKVVDGLFFIFIRLYQKTISPDKGILSFWLKGKICAHEPHCSEYAKQHLRRYGRRKSLIPISDRIINCTPSYEKNYDPPYYKIVFFSSAKIGIPFLKKLINNNKFEVVGVVTQPDQPIGRGHKLQSNIVKSWVEDNHLDIEVVTPSKIDPDKTRSGNKFYTWLQSKQPDYLVVISYGKILPIKILNLPKIGPINIHGSLLPAYRGPSPLQSTFLDDNDKTGMTMMFMDTGVDTGDIISQKTIPIKFEYTVANLIEQFEKIGPNFLIETLIDYAKNNIGRTIQDEENTILTRKIEKQDGLIDIFNTDIKTIYSKYRAYFLWPKIRFVYRDKRYIVEKLVLHKHLYEANLMKPLFYEGHIDKHHIHPSIKELVIKPEGKKSVSYEQWINGMQGAGN